MQALHMMAVARFLLSYIQIYLMVTVAASVKPTLVLAVV
jgi:hypothetical protein